MPCHFGRQDQLNGYLTTNPFQLMVVAHQTLKREDKREDKAKVANPNPQARSMSARETTKERAARHTTPTEQTLTREANPKAYQRGSVYNALNLKRCLN